jgi:hypothetical protein
MSDNDPTSTTSEIAHYTLRPGEDAFDFSVKSIGVLANRLYFLREAASDFRRGDIDRETFLGKVILYCCPEKPKWDEMFITESLIHLFICARLQVTGGPFLFCGSPTPSAFVALIETWDLINSITIESEEVQGLVRAFLEALRRNDTRDLEEEEGFLDETALGRLAARDKEFHRSVAAFPVSDLVDTIRAVFRHIDLEEIMAGVAQEESYAYVQLAGKDKQDSPRATPLRYLSVPQARDLNATEKRIIQHCRRKAHKGERIAKNLGLSYDHTRRILGRLVREGRLRKTDDGYRSPRRAT